MSGDPHPPFHGRNNCLNFCGPSVMPSPRGGASFSASASFLSWGRSDQNLRREGVYAEGLTEARSSGVLSAGDARSDWR